RESARCYRLVGTVYFNCAAKRIIEDQRERSGGNCGKGNSRCRLKLQALRQGQAIVNHRALRSGKVAADGVKRAGSASQREIMQHIRRCRRTAAASRGGRWGIALHRKKAGVVVYQRRLQRYIDGVATVCRHDGAAYGLRSGSYHVGIKVDRRIGVASRAIRHKALLPHHVVVECLDGAAVFIGENRLGSVVIGLRNRVVHIRALHGGEHRILAIAEIIAFHEHGGAQRRAGPVLSIAVVVVVVDVRRIKTNPRVP
nr:hypothetical protein [Tanacetum cinerariifolium]